MREKSLEVKADMLAAEYQEATVELLKKQCYAQGVLAEITKTAQDYYEHYNGKWVRDYYIDNLEIGFPARIIKLTVESWMDSVHVFICVGLNPRLVGAMLPMTQKEKQLIHEASRIWEDSLHRCYFDNDKRFIDINDELHYLKNGMEIANSLHFYFDAENMKRGCNICNNYILIQEHEDRRILLRDFNIYKLTED